MPDTNQQGMGQIAHSTSALAVVPPPHLGSKYVEYSTKIQPPTFVGKTAVDIAFFRAKQQKMILHFSTRFPQISTERKSMKRAIPKQAF